MVHPLTDKPKETWEYDPQPLLESGRKVKGIFHKSVIDKDGERITPDAIRKSIPDYMHLPALHDFHKERPVGLATKVWENSDGSFGFEGVIKATEDCNDVWDKIQKGNYDHVSIFGKREEGNNNCSLPAPLRSGACITTGVRLDSISVCDDNARNDATSLEVRKGMMIVDVDELKKAETTDGELQHASTDYSDKDKKRGYRINSKGEVIRIDTKSRATMPEYERPDVGKCKPCKREDPNTIQKEEVKAWGDEHNIKTGEGEQRQERVAESPRGGKPRTGEKVRWVERPKKEFDTPQDGKRTFREPMATIRAEPKKKAEHPAGRVRVTEAPKSKEHAEHKIVHRGRYDTPQKPEVVNPQLHPPKTEGRRGNPSAERKPGEAAHNKPPAGHKPTGNVKFTSHTTKRGTEPMATVGAEYGHPGAKIGGEQLVPPDKGTASALDRKKNTERQDSAGTKLSTKSEKVEKYYPQNAKQVDEMSREDRLAWHGKKKNRAQYEHWTDKNSEVTDGYKKGDDEGEDMSNEMEKGEKRIPPAEEKTPTKTRRAKEGDKKALWAKKPAFDKADTEMEKGSTADELEDENYDEDEDKDFKHAKPTDKEGQWSKNKDPNGTVKMSKANEKDESWDADEDDEDTPIRKPRKGAEKEKGKQDKGKPEEPEEEEEEEEEVEKGEDVEVEKGEDVEVEKGEFDRQPLEHLGGKSLHQHLKEGLKGEGSTKTAKHSQRNARIARTGRASQKRPGMSNNEVYADDAAAGLKHMTKAKGDEDAASESFNPSTVSKGEQMDEQENDVEYVTKALVPIEEIDTIVKARTEEISKAYVAQLDEIKKAYDTKFVELSSKIEKMENETIRKGGSVVVIPELMSGNNGSFSNADALARMQAGR